MDATHIDHDTNNLKENYGSKSQSKSSNSDFENFEDIHKKGSSKMTSAMNSPTSTDSVL